MKSLRALIALTSTLCALNACGGGSLNENHQAKESPPPASAAPTIPTFTGKRADYTITRTTNGITVQQKTGSGSATNIGNAMSVKFDDMTLNLMIGEKAASIATKDLNSLIDLYVAFFNRVPDADGLSYWIDQFKSGRTLDQIAQNFYSAALLYSAQTGYDATMTDADFVRVIYKNVLGRSGANAPPNADVQYWADELKNGRSKGNLISVMLVSARSFANDVTWGWVTTLLDNKVTVGTYFAVQQGINYNTPEESISKTIAIVAAITPTTTATAKNLIGVNDAQFNLSVPADTSRTRKAIFAGYDHSFAIKNDGTLWAWGNNQGGELCLGDEIVSTIPTLVTAISDVVEVAAGKAVLSDPLLLKKDGTVWKCENDGKPKLLAGLSNIVSIATENSAAYALAEDGTLWHIDLYYLLKPKHKNVLSGVASLASGSNYTLALKKDGTVWAVGYNTFGQLGFGDKTRRDLFAHTSNFDGANAVAAGGIQGFAIKPNGTVFASGMVWAPLQIGAFEFAMPKESTVPSPVASLDNVIELAIGTALTESHVLALKKDGSVWSWGSKRWGASGLGSMEHDTYLPTKVANLDNIIAIAAGESHSLALKKDGTLWVSGSNDSAQLGIGRSTNTFVQIPGWSR